MNDSLNLLYYIMNKFLDFMFDSYIFDGVSLGMLFIVMSIFTILLKYMLSIPNISIPHSRKDYNSSTVGGSLSNADDKPIRS